MGKKTCNYGLARDLSDVKLIAAQRLNIFQWLIQSTYVTAKITEAVFRLKKR